MRTIFLAAVAAVAVVAALVLGEIASRSLQAP
jgi:hypothetical protein